MSPPPSPHLDDEALSGVLDETATASERAHTESCPSCRDRLDHLRTASRLVASPVNPPSAARRDAAINAALAAAAADRSLTRPEPISSVPTVTRRAHIPAWIGAVAAAVLVVALAVPLLVRGGHQTAKSSSAARTTTRASDTSGLQSEAAAGSKASGASAADAAARPLAAAPELGAIADINELASAVRTSIGSGAGVGAFGAAPTAGTAGATATTVKKSTATTVARASAAPACSPPPGDGGPVFTARVVWQGSPASIYGFGTLPPGMRVVVILDGSCATAATTVV